MEQAISESALNGLTSLQQLGLAGIFLSFLLMGAIVAIWYFARNCDRRTEASIQAFKDESSSNRHVIEKNTDAFNGVQIALARIESRMDK